MLNIATIQSSDQISQNGVELLFNQQNDQKKAGTNKLKSIDLDYSKPHSDKSDHHLHWSKRLFSSTKTVHNLNNKLIITRSRQILFEYELRSSQSELLIGNHELSDIKLGGKKIEPFHAKITYQDGQYQLLDLGSEHGTFLNGKKIQPKCSVALHHGARFHIMAYQIHFEAQQKQNSSLFPKISTFENNIDSDLSCLTARPDDIKNHVCPVSSHLIKSSADNKIWQKGTSEMIVTDVINETNNVKTLRLVGITPSLFSYLPGQFVSLLLNIEGKPVSRCYSISSSPSRPHTLDLTIKRVPGGLVSNWLCDHVKPGDQLKVKGPEGRFSCLIKPAKKILLIGAGSGVTPLMSMTRWVFDTASEVDLQSLFSFSHLEDVIFNSDIEMINGSNKSIEIAVALTGNHKTPTNDYKFKKRIDIAMLESFSADLQDREIFLCGPVSFMENIKRLLNKLNHPKENLHCESFGNPHSFRQQKGLQYQKKASSKQTDATSNIQAKTINKIHTVRFIKSNKVVQVDENTNLLALAESEGLKIDFNCRTGSCAECMVKCLSGHVSMNEDCEIDQHEREQGWIFSCCSFANSNLVIDA